MNYLKLNTHGKECLKTYLLSISASDIKTTQIDYLWHKDLIKRWFRAEQIRKPLAGYALTDLGMETAQHYFPQFTINQLATPKKL